MNKTWKLFTVLLVAAIATTVLAQTYETPALSPLDIVNWSNRGGFVASGTGDPTATVATGALYVDNTDPAQPKLWRYSGSAWAQLSGADSATLLNHIASDTDPHGSTMKVSEEVQIGDPAEAPWAYIDSPAEGQVRFDYYITIIGSSSAPTPSAGSIYFNTGDNHFYGYNGSSWVQLDN